MCEGEEEIMTKQEASERYNIPIWLLDEYESWGLCQEVKKVMRSWQYDDSNLERLSMIMTLHDVGFTGSEIETYMRLLLEGDHTKEQRIQMLTRKRDHALDEVIDTAPVSMACTVEDVYKTEGFESFICKIAATYAEESVLDNSGRLDYSVLKPVLFEMPTYQYLKTGEVLGKCMNMGRKDD